jgi:putative flippase GtrA
MGRLSRDSSSTIGGRWLRFNLGGAIGIGVQLMVLGLLRTGLHLNLMLATALAVEAAVVHNFLWHERFTWVDRLGISQRESLARFLKFNMSTGWFSIVGNLVLMKALAEMAHMNYVADNLITIATCSVVNFVVSDRVVFSE